MTEAETPPTTTPNFSNRRLLMVMVGITTAFLLILIVVTGIAVNATSDAKTAKTAAESAQAAIDLSNAQKLDARIAACNVDRNFATAHNALVKSVQNLVTTVFRTVSGDQNADTKAQVEILIRQLNDPIDLNVVPVRQCDPKSVAAFYDDQPAAK